MLSSVTIEYTDHGDPRDPRLHPEPEDAQDARILTVAEAGFSMLSGYGGLTPRPFSPQESPEALGAFAAKINSTDTAEYLPTQRLAAVPSRFFRDLRASDEPAHMEHFKAVLTDFFLKQATEFRAKNLFVDYRVCPEPGPAKYIEATIDVLNALPEYASVRRVMFFTNLRQDLLPCDFDNRADFERVTGEFWPENWPKQVRL